QRDFERYLLHERRLAEATVGNYLGVSRAFLSTHRNNGTVDPHQLSPTDVLGFVRRVAQTRPPRSAKFTITGLRAFLRFLYVQGRTATDLAASVPTVPHWQGGGTAQVVERPRGRVRAAQLRPDDDGRQAGLCRVVPPGPARPSGRGSRRHDPRRHR